MGKSGIAIWKEVVMKISGPTRRLLLQKRDEEVNWAYGSRYGGKEWFKKELGGKCESWKTEESEAIEALTSPQNLMGCQNSVIKTNNILMQYFFKNQN